MKIILPSFFLCLGVFIITCFSAGSSSSGEGLQRPNDEERQQLEPKNVTCQMLIAIDEPLFRHYQSNFDKVTELIAYQMQRLNDFFHGILYFSTKEIRFLYNFCTECNRRNFLDSFYRMNHSDYCLAHVFTYRNFDGEALSQGFGHERTVCNSKDNIGYTTFLKNQETLTWEEGAITFAQGVVRNFGALFDEDTGCSSDFIMSRKESKDIVPQLPPCSIQSINQTIKLIFNHPLNNCFTQSNLPFDIPISACGGGIFVEGDDQCYCKRLSSEDPRCYGLWIESTDFREKNSTDLCKSMSSITCFDPFQNSGKEKFMAQWITQSACVVLFLSCFIY